MQQLNFKSHLARASKKKLSPTLQGVVAEQQSSMLAQSTASEQLELLTSKQADTAGGMPRELEEEEAENTFWISISGYQADAAYLVYRFFLDIGHIGEKCFTKSNLMYLKYETLLDCRIALSYNNQRIGYAGDILVKVKAENPAIDICKTDVTLAQAPLEASVEQQALASRKPRALAQKRSFTQWLKQKISYFFYFY
ncbi:CG1421 [Drosophila busckii]|uniref:Nucleoporin NUP35 n=1 Tax=Drosophila busckii TaxID=30019 RepID=A0A0M4E9L0_DROBS|nr:uncharacterized protein LOC108604203 [Drosophila busckii]ALC39852.1 CG1421 [Drosophila busckii]